MASIYFYNEDETHWFLTNFYISNFTDEQGNEYCCNEQFFMKKKQELFDPANLELAAAILASKSPSIIKGLGRQVSNFSDKVWDEHKYEIMKAGLRLKFRQNDDLRRRLLATAPLRLYEASPKDRVWGIGYSADALPADESLYGQNLLGKALEEVRNELWCDEKQT
jgi:ribA/ribD-fused uncharacterized protein